MIGNLVGDLEMPVLPLIDLALFVGLTSILAGFILKAVALTTSYRPALLGLSSIDFLLIAGAAMLFAITLAARTWVKTQEPGAVAERRRRETLDAWDALPQDAGEDVPDPAEVLANQAKRVS